MDLEPLKEKLGDETFAKLTAFVTDLTGQRDTARQESINGRKGLKAERDSAVAERDEALELVGVSSLQELREKPNAKASAEEAQQLKTQLNRAMRERDDAKKMVEEVSGKHRSSLQQAAVAKALGGHEFVARDIVETYVGQRLTWEGDDLFFKTDDGKLVSVADGVAGIAKARPELLKPTGTGGAGVRQSSAGSGGGAKTMTRADWDATDHGARASFVKEGGKVVD